MNSFKTRMTSALMAALCAGQMALFPAAAAANPYAENIEARVLTGWRNGGTHHVAALELTLAEGWKTYWRAPGDAGVPPIFEWHGSDNIASVSIVWPTPEVIDQNGMTSIGYHGHVVLPLLIEANSPDAAVIKGALQIGICKDICVPISLKVRADLPPQGRSDARIHAALAAQPQSGAAAGAGKATCSIEVIEAGLRLTAHLPLPKTGGTEIAIVESNDPQIWVSEATTTRQGGTLTTTAELIHMTGEAFALDRAGLRFTVLGRDRAVDIRGCAAR